MDRPSQPATISPRRRKNILFVSFDDAVSPWAYKTAFGEPLQTPNLDRLCQNATAFHAAYAQAPICAPSRASMMMGQMPPRTGILDNSSHSPALIDPDRIWSNRLRENGYYCSSGGKVHHGFKPLRPAVHRALYDDRRKRFPSDVGISDEVRKRAKAFGGFRKGFGTADHVDDDTFYDRKVADSAIEFLEKYDRDAPFYREVGFFGPHVPWITPARFKRMYDARKLTIPPDWTGYVNDNRYVMEHIPERTELRSVKFWQDSVRNYFSAYSHGDHQLGRVLDALRQSRHSQNTIVAVISDHGFHLGNRNLLRKTTLWEQSLRVPMVIFDPDNPVGRRVESPVALIDIGPTLLDLAGLSPPDGCDGRPLRSALSGGPVPERAIPSFYKGNMAIREGDYRLIRYEDGSMQLFDVIGDFWQLRDLGSGHDAFPRMQRLLIECAQEYGFNLSETGTAATGAAGPDPDE